MVLESITAMAMTPGSDLISDTMDMDIVKELYPTLYRNGKQHLPRECWREDSRLITCKFSDETSVSLAFRNQTVTLKVSSKQSVVWDSVTLEGKLDISHDSYVLQNGLQSWSLSSWVKLNNARSIHEISQWLNMSDESPLPGSISRDIGAIGNDLSHLVLGVLSAKTLPSWISFSKEGSQEVKFIAGTGLVQEKIHLSPSKSFTTDPWTFIQEDDIETSLKEYTNLLEMYPTVQSPAFGWNSWYYYWSHIKQKNIESNINPFSTLSKQWQVPETSNMSYVIDDGWQQQWGDWTQRSNFNLQQLSTQIQESGLTPGIWIAPFLLRPTSATARAHPEWLVDGLIYQHGSGDNKVLDTTHPEAIKHIQSIIRKLVRLGYKTLKIDFLVAASLPGKRYLPVTALEAYHLGLKAIREAAGPDVYLIASGGLSLASFPYVNSWRTGPDIAFEFPSSFLGPTWTDVAVQSHNLSARWFFCSRIHCDTDPMLFRGSYKKEQAESAAHLIAMAGGGLHVSEKLTEFADFVNDIEWPENFWSQALGNQPATPIIEYESLNTKTQSPSHLDRVLHLNSIRGQERWRLPNGQEVRFNYLGHPQSIGGVKLNSRSSIWP